MVTGFDEVKIGVKYVCDGVELTHMPASLDTYSKVQVIYETLPGWTEDITQAKSFDELPANCKTYVLRLEEVNI